MFASSKMAAGGPNREDRRQRIYDRDGTNTSSNDPNMMEARVFIGNLLSKKITRQQIEERFSKYGNILGVSLHRNFGFVQFETQDMAQKSVKGENGKDMYGLKMDICIATERRKDRAGASGGFEKGGGGGAAAGGGGSSSRRRHRSRSPSFHRHRSSRDHDHLGRYDRFSPPPPPPRMRGPPPLDYRDPFVDPYLHPPDDLYDSYPPPRDFYDHYPPPLGRDYLSPPPPSYLSDYPPRKRRERPPPFEDHPWDYPPRERERDPPPILPRREERDLFKTNAPPIAPPPVVDKGSPDVQIMIVNSQQKEYAQRIRDRVEALGLVVEPLHLSPTVSLAEALENAAHRGLLYTVIVTSQHEAHRSVTLTILHGRNPQEHKNMPLEDAIGLINRDYERYCQTNRLSGEKSTAALMAKAASGHNLSSSELNVLISSLQQKQQGMQRGSSGRSMDVRDSMPSVSSEDIQQQQADLQAKILSLLGSNAVVPSGSGSGSSSKPSGSFLDEQRFSRGGGSYGDSFGSFGSSSFR